MYYFLSSFSNWFCSKDNTLRCPRFGAILWSSNVKRRIARFFFWFSFVLLLSIPLYLAENDLGKILVELTIGKLLSFTKLSVSSSNEEVMLLFCPCLNF